MLCDMILTKLRHIASFCYSLAIPLRTVSMTLLKSDGDGTPHKRYSEFRTVRTLHALCALHQLVRGSHCESPALLLAGSVAVAVRKVMQRLLDVPPLWSGDRFDLWIPRGRCAYTYEMAILSESSDSQARNV